MKVYGISFHLTTTISIRLLSSCIIVLFSSYSIFGQVQSDFSDPYDYNLRNYQDEKSPDGFQEYAIPPKFDKPILVNPKNAQVPFQNALPTSTGAQGTRRTTNPTQTRQDDGLFNPITGEVNIEALERQQTQERDRKKKLTDFGKEREPYTETRLRRFSIIFFMTLPLAGGLSYGALSFFKPGYEKTLPGGWIVFGVGASLAFANAWSDLNEYDRMKLENQPESPTPNPTVPDRLSETIHPTTLPGLGPFTRNSENRFEMDLLRANF
ncbi:hypothetical protein LEP1GSC050_2973 [Leptospira broomii serovar Hurstbridge str. 5399]|uniref:Uncharacterized protein n=1 Tax=Leptospira broomii serovar Hurstbridge str. 5399 TaxID=1049789 RepID=T0FCJ1_9LEPT|nr:hypothetical protein [Leptospira broomii]EQA45571.1 hypothetical protein LEP1GSC050_2973 [Leptospira broomii serovar Hurstbridge str. 5399]